MTEEIVFFVNGPARLLMSCVIANELYPDRTKHLILLEQYGYRYDALLPHTRRMFDRVYAFGVRAHRYSHMDQLLNTYLNPYSRVRRMLVPGQRLILFGLRSPAQKFMIRHSKRLGNPVEVYAESVSVNRYFAPRAPESTWRDLAGRVFTRAFEYQHDYDCFHVLDPNLYADSPNAGKLVRMFNLYGSPSFARYASLLTADLDLSAIATYDEVFLGQPLSDNATFLKPAEEEAMLREIIGDRRVLVLPHPGERLSPGNDKYRVVPNARVFRGGVPSELVLLKLRPTMTHTYYSTAGVNYAMMNAGSVNHFYPIHRSMHAMLRGFARSLPNMRVTDRYVVGDDPYRSPRQLVPLANAPDGD